MRPKVLRWVGALVVSLLWSPGALQANDDLRLVDAAKSQASQAISALLNQRVDVNVSGPDGTTALHWAVHWDDLASVNALLHAGARANVSNDYGVTPLWLACENASSTMVARLLEAGADPAAALLTGETVLMTAARTGNERAVRALLAKGADVSAREELHGQTALMWAVAEGHVGVARVLLDGGADVNARTQVLDRASRPDGQLGGRNNARIDSGFTPLLFAAREGGPEMFRLLLARGADLTAVSAAKANALLVATVRGHVELAKFVLDQGMDANFDGPGYTALHWAAGTWESVTTHDYHSDLGEWRAMAGVPDRHDKMALIEALLAHGADINARATAAPPRYGFSFGRNVVGATPFYLATSVGDVEVMRLLLAKGADPRLAVKDGTTPLMAAAGLAYVDEETTAPEARFLETIKLLLETGADVNATNDDGETPLHAASYEGFNSIVEFLVAEGGHVNARNKAGRTPTSLADGVNVRGKLYIHPDTAVALRRLGGVTDSAAEEAAVREAQDEARRRR